MKRNFRNRLLSILLSLSMAMSLLTVGAGAVSEPAAPAAGGEFDAALTLESLDWVKSEDGTYYAARGVEYCTNVVAEDIQFMNIFVPAAYIEGGEVNGYTAETAPVVLMNNCMGWNSSTPGELVTMMGSYAHYVEAGFVFVNCGARSRDLGAIGKAPTAVVDLKSAVRMLKLNGAVIPGDEEKIISVGSSGGGQMSSILGASGNMDEYYAHLYENGAAGIAKVGSEYVSTIGDDVYGAMCYCPIADLSNGDIAYAWMRYGAEDTTYTPMMAPPPENGFDELQLTLTDQMADAYVDYINSLGLVNLDGEPLSIEGVRAGSYYEQTLKNISDAFNAFVANQKFPFSVTLGFGPTATVLTYNTIDELIATYTNTDQWLVKNADGTYAITDLDGFVKGTALPRNKDIPGYDTILRTEEGNAFGTAEEAAVHYSASTAAVMANMLADESLTALIDGAYYGDPSLTYRDIFNAYIEEANRPDVVNQVYLMNATQIMLDCANGEQEADFAPYWRTRNGTADEHTSFSTAYNLAMAANMAGADVDYSLVWGMTHGDAEGESTGTFVEWVNEICAAPEAPANPFVDVTEGAYYYEPVLWAVENGITTGATATTFAPDAPCTRAQVVTFLWRAAGSPKAENAANPFTDVKEGDYYYDAVLWAVENGITTGATATTFAPDAPCTRGQVVTFLHRANGETESAAKNGFTDVTEGAYYYDAVLWAVENGVTTGATATTFAPDASCTRGQIVTFLFRADGIEQPGQGEPPAGEPPEGGPEDPGQMDLYTDLVMNGDGTITLTLGGLAEMGDTFDVNGVVYTAGETITVAAIDGKVVIKSLCPAGPLAGVEDTIDNIPSPEPEQPEQPGQGEPPAGEPPAGEPPAGGQGTPPEGVVFPEPVPGDSSFAAYQAYLTECAKVLWNDSFVDTAIKEVGEMTEENYGSAMMYSILVGDMGALSYEAWQEAVNQPAPPAGGEGEEPPAQPDQGEPPADGPADPGQMDLYTDLVVNGDGTVTLTLGGLAEMGDTFEVNGVVYPAGETITAAAVDGKVVVKSLCPGGPLAGAEDTITL